MNCSDSSDSGGQDRCVSAEKIRRGKCGGALEECGKRGNAGERPRHRMDAGETRVQGRNQPDKQHGQHRNQCAGACIAQHGAAPDAGNRDARTERHRSAQRGFDSDSEPGTRVPGCAKALALCCLSLSAGNRRECDGGNCHPHPGVSVASRRHFKCPSYILPQMVCHTKAAALNDIQHFDEPPGQCTFASGAQIWSGLAHSSSAQISGSTSRLGGCGLVGGKGASLGFRVANYHLARRFHCWRCWASIA